MVSVNGLQSAYVLVGGGEQTSCLCERVMSQYRENTFCRPALCSKTTRFKWPSTPLLYIPVLMAKRRRKIH